MIDTVDFQVIGELRANPDQLLLRGTTVSSTPST